MPDMKIHAGLPRVLKGSNWPRAVAVATADLAPSGSDTMLIAVTDARALSALGTPAKIKAEAGENKLYEVEGFIDDISAVQAIDPHARIIGCLPHPLKDKGAFGAKTAS